MTTWRPRRPEEGWLTLALVVAIALILAWAVDDPAWVNGKEELTDPLMWFALFGVAVGFAGPKLGWGRWTTHLVGAVFAGLLIPILAGLAIAPGSSIPEAFGITAAGTIEAYLDIAWRQLQFTDEEIHYIVVLGAVIWATAQFASYAVFGHRRPLNAVVMVGIVLLANMSLTDQLEYLVALTAASLFLLIEMHAFDERATWIRRRIGDPSTISSLYLRGGTVFIVVALVGSMVLTTRAASDPLAGAWEGIGDQLIDLGEELAGILPEGGDLRPFGGVTFGSTANIDDTWISDPGVAFTAIVPTGEEELYWRAATYDAFRLSGWGQSEGATTRVEAGQALLAGSAAAPIEARTRPITVTVRPDKFRDPTLLSPGSAVAANRPADVELTGADGWFANADLPGGRGEYTVEARLIQFGVGDGKITGHQLEAASTVYPAEIRSLYTGVPDGTLGNDARELLATILEEAGTTNPYRLAMFMQDFFRDSTRFEYSPDVSDVPCTDDSKVECFARRKSGPCLHYASTMAMLLREANPRNPIPTRLVQGFLPAKPLGNTVTVELRGAHAWVEVYVPDYGWIPFDPTGGGLGPPTVIPDGPAVPLPTPGPSGSLNPDDRGPDFTRRPDINDGGVAVPPGGPGDRTLLIVLTVLLTIVIITAAAAAWLRGPRGEVTPDTAWRSMSRSASRFGFGPRPTQTVYEYAATLGDLVPVAQADLQTVAEAKVETTYANVRLGGARLEAVRAATRRLRISLLRLLIRRPGRRKRH